MIQAGNERVKLIYGLQNFFGNLHREFHLFLANLRKIFCFDMCGIISKQAQIV